MIFFAGKGRMVHGDQKGAVITVRPLLRHRELFWAGRL
jgi:hypothetical protein